MTKLWLGKRAQIFFDIDVFFQESLKQLSIILYIALSHNFSLVRSIYLVEEH